MKERDLVETRDSMRLSGDTGESEISRAVVESGGRSTPFPHFHDPKHGTVHKHNSQVLCQIVLTVLESRNHCCSDT